MSMSRIGEDTSAERRLVAHGNDGCERAWAGGAAISSRAPAPDAADVRHSRPVPSAKPPASLESLRARIDAVDDRIARALASRARLAKEIGKAKRHAKATELHDPEREQRVLERLTRAGAAPFPKPTLRAIYREIMSACLSLEQTLHVAFLGPEGTFTESAARSTFGLAAHYKEAATIEAVFDAVESGACTYGVVPYENSSEGSVSATNDALIERPLKIRREHVLPITHSLLSTTARTAQLERVYSHPQALGQCRSWLARHLPRAQLVHSPSTAAAAHDAANDERGAAIGSALLAERFALRVVVESIQDHARNATRFVVVAKSDAPPTGSDRTTIVFSLGHTHGALRKVLSVFEAAGLNLTRIDSRPSRRAPWTYVFLVDIEGHRRDANVASALATLRAHTRDLKVVGSYPRADLPTTRRPRRR